jgi:hypothetical protein
MIDERHGKGNQPHGKIQTYEASHETAERPQHKEGLKQHLGSNSGRTSLEDSGTEGLTPMPQNNKTEHQKLLDRVDYNQ